MDALILCFSGLCLVWSTGAFVLKRATYKKCKTATGKVLELVEETGSGDDLTTFAPRVAFETHRGEHIEFLEGYSSSRAVAQVGQDVRVIYDPASPTDARLDRWMNRHGSELMLFAFGVIGISIYAFRQFSS